MKHSNKVDESWSDHMFTLTFDYPLSFKKKKLLSIFLMFIIYNVNDAH